MPNSQSGFRNNFSTCTALLNLFSDLYEAKDKNKCSTLVILDYSQAFDSICHKLLVKKLKYFGFDEASLRWIESYLTGRSQVTKLGNKVSSTLQKIRGVPQGSCLGPILFNIYTADVESVVKSCSIHLYADDCQLMYSYNNNFVEEAMHLINNDLESLAVWSECHGLQLNIGKCSVLHVAPPDVQNALKKGDIGSVTVCGQTLHICEKVKTLGVVLDEGLTLSNHVSHVCQQALGRLRGLYRFKCLLPEEARIRVIRSLVLSVFEYCFPVYGNSISKGDRDKIQKLQNTAVRFIYNLKKREHITPYRESARLAPMNISCKVQTCTLVHKTMSLGIPMYLKEKLPARCDVSERRTRQSDFLHVPRVNREVGRKGFTYFAPTLYNSIPCTIRQSSVLSFKKKIKDVFEN